jgi:hypothetical protein
MFLVLFDSKGRLRPSDSFSEEELSDLTAEQRRAFDEVRAAGEHLEKLEAEVAECSKQITVDMDNVRAATVARDRALPKRTYLDEWRSMKAQSLVDAGYEELPEARSGA